MGQTIKRGLIQAFYNSTYTADVLILESTSTLLQGVPVGVAHDGTSTLVQAYCAVLFFDENNPNDAVVIAVYPNATQGVPAAPPGRITFVTGNLQINAVVINTGVTTSFQITGGGGIPGGALGVLWFVFFTSPTTGTFISIAPTGATINHYAAIGNLTVAGGFVNANGITALSASGQLDIKAGGGNCTVSMYTYGYII